MKINKLKQKKGYVTIVILILMLVLVAASYLYADALFGEVIISRNNRASSIAFSLAEAGVQEAVFRIQQDATTRDVFINTPNGLTSFSHDPALLNNGKYNVTIQNTARGAATVTAVGSYTIGSRTARREVRADITQATLAPPYDDDGAMFSHSAGGESTGDLEFSSANISIYGGSLHSGRDISFKDGVYSVEKGVKAERNINEQQNPVINCNCEFVDSDPLVPQCSENPGCSYSHLPAMDMPMIDFDSESAGSYKNLAIAQNQYYLSQEEFYTKTGFGNGQTKTLSGVVYIEGGITIEHNRHFIINGVLATSGSITVGGGMNGSLTVNQPGAGDAAGALAQNSFTVTGKGSFAGTALIYTGFRVDFESSATPVNFTGGILTRRVYVNNRTMTIHFDAGVINSTLQQPQDTPVIQLNHWEEEY